MALLSAAPSSCLQLRCRECAPSLRLLLRRAGDTDCNALLRTRAGGDFAGLRTHKTLSGEVVKPAATLQACRWTWQNVSLSGVQCWSNR